MSVFSSSVNQLSHQSVNPMNHWPFLLAKWTDLGFTQAVRGPLIQKLLASEM